MEGDGMKAFPFVLCVVVAAIALTPRAAGSGDATKQRVAIETSHDSFVLTPLKPDTGTNACTGVDRDGESFQDGQQAFTHDCTAWTFSGKRGTLVVRNRF